MAIKESGKLAKVRKRGYVSVVYVKIFTHYLSVPKGEDIRMVYNLVGIIRGLNPLYFVLLDQGADDRSTGV